MDRSEMAALLEQLVGKLYDGAPIPACEGGRLFRNLCEERREAGDLYWTERHIHELARQLGYWPWSVDQIGRACSDARLNTVAQPLAAPLPFV
jgi:hypothetical protein